MRKACIWRIALAAAATLFATGALAQSASVADVPPDARGFAVDAFEPAERGSEWFVVDSLDLRGIVRPSAGIVPEYEHSPFVVYDQTNGKISSIVKDQLLLHAGGSVTVLDRLRLGASIPLVAYDGGQSATVAGLLLHSPPKEQAVGDLRLSLDVRLLGKYRAPLELAIGVRAWLPTGSTANYMGDGERRVAPQILLAGDLGYLTYGARAGFLDRKRKEILGDSPIGNAFTAAAAIGGRLLDGRLVVGPEVFGSMGVDGEGLYDRKATLEAILGAHATLGALRVGAGVGRGVVRGLGAPTFRGLLSVEYVTPIPEDRDGDGVLDRDDACPLVKGVLTSDRASNGCPPPDRDHDLILDADDACPLVAGVPSSDRRFHGCPDRDHDGILDAADACPDDPGIASTDPALHGCPDRDHDGILDKVDACPDEAGIASKDPKVHGCPDKDGDGVPDKVDACRDVPGVATSDPKTNGCPDPDRDKDGIPNEADACPDTAGPASPDPKTNGCPGAAVVGEEIKIREQVRFKLNSDEIAGGEDTLRAVLKILVEHPDFSLRVEGHTEPPRKASAAELNKALSAKRAASIVKWLVAHGIDAKRLTSAGMGAEKPLVPNDTEAGRSANRRVELHIEQAAR